MDEDAAYRIEVVHDPHATTYPYDAKVYTVDGWLLTTVFGLTVDGAIKAAREWAERQSNADASAHQTLWLTETGADAEPPVVHSGRV